MKNWKDNIDKDNLPGDLTLIADLLGLEMAIKLAETFGGGQLYIPQASSVFLAAKRLFVLENKDKTIKELRILTGLSDQTIIKMRSAQKEADKQQSLL